MSEATNQARRQAEATSRLAEAQRGTARHTSRLADAHTRQAAALERIADALESALRPEPQPADVSPAQTHHQEAHRDE